jgi:hypothetical protein
LLGSDDASVVLSWLRARRPLCRNLQECPNSLSPARGWVARVLVTRWPINALGAVAELEGTRDRRTRQMDEPRTRDGVGALPLSGRGGLHTDRTRFGAESSQVRQSAATIAFDARVLPERPWRSRAASPSTWDAGRAAITLQRMAPLRAEAARAGGDPVVLVNRACVSPAPIPRACAWRPPSTGQDWSAECSSAHLRRRAYPWHAARRTPDPSLSWIRVPRSCL